MLLVKFIVLLLLGFVIISLFSGLYFLVKDKGQSNRTVNALSYRVGLSVLAIVIIMIAGATGVIEMNPNPSFIPADSPTFDQPPSADANARTLNSAPAAIESESSFGGRTRIEN